MTNAPGSHDRPPPPLGSSHVTPATDTRRVLVGAGVPVVAVITWLLVTITGHALWWALLVVAALAGVAVWVTSGRASSRSNRSRND